MIPFVTACCTSSEGRIADQVYSSTFGKGVRMQYESENDYDTDVKIGKSFLAPPEAGFDVSNPIAILALNAQWSSDFTIQAAAVA